MDFLTESGEPTTPLAGALLACDTLEECVRVLDAFCYPADKRKGLVLDLCVHRMREVQCGFVRLTTRHQCRLDTMASVRNLFQSLSHSDTGSLIGSSTGSSCGFVDPAADYD